MEQSDSAERDTKGRPGALLRSTMDTRTTSANGSNPRIVTTKAKLQSLNEKIMGFEKQLESDARSRRETEESRATLIRDSLAKLDKALNNEIKRRVESHKGLQTMLENHLTGFEEKLDAVICDKIDQLRGAVASLTNRISSIEQGFATEKNRRKAELQQRAGAIAKDQGILMNLLESEKKAFAEKDDVLLKKLVDLEQRTERVLQQDKEEREKRLMQLQLAIQEASQQRDMNDDKFQNYVYQEINNIKQALLAESRTRETTDDEIVHAVNHYTRALQEAIKLINNS